MGPGNLVQLFVYSFNQLPWLTTVLPGPWTTGLCHPQTNVALTLYKEHESHPLSVMRGMRQTKDRAALMIHSFHFSLPTFGPCPGPKSLVCGHPGARGRGQGAEGRAQASCAGEKRFPGKQRRCRDCWRKESSFLSAEAQANIFCFFLHVLCIYLLWSL